MPQSAFRLCSCTIRQAPFPSLPNRQSAAAYRSRLNTLPDPSAGKPAPHVHHRPPLCPLLFPDSLPLLKDFHPLKAGRHKQDSQPPPLLQPRHLQNIQAQDHNSLPPYTARPLYNTLPSIFPRSSFLSPVHCSLTWPLYNTKPPKYNRPVQQLWRLSASDAPEECFPRLR